MRVATPFFFLFALGISASSFAQKGSPAPASGNSFIEVDGGVSLPMGNWGKASTATSLMSINGTVNDKSGYAKTGGFFSIDGAWFFSRHFGIGGMFKYGTHSLKGVDSLSQGYEESFDVDQTATTVTNYKLWSVLPGIYYDWQFAGKFGLTARALAGIAHASTPGIDVAIEDGGVPDPAVVQSPASKTAFATDLGVGLQYAIFNCIALHLRTDYFYTKPDFAIDNSGRNNNAGREVGSYDEPLESMNFSLGLAYIFGHNHK